ncbi:MAG: hypothetical protein ABF449_10625 [Ethanoligenens sp.]
MKRIRGSRDIQNLRKWNRTYKQIAAYLEQYWMALERENTDFPPEGYVPIVLLERPQDAEQLGLVGIHAQYRHTFPEYVELIALEDGVQLYNACVLLNNEDTINIFSIKGILDARTERFLEAECK